MKKEACYLFAGGNRFRVDQLESYKVIEQKAPKTKAKAAKKNATATNETEAIQSDIMTAEE